MSKIDRFAEVGEKYDDLTKVATAIVAGVVVASFCLGRLSKRTK